VTLLASATVLCHRLALAIVPVYSNHFTTFQSFCKVIANLLYNVEI
jgi:hypothetical protein